MSRASVPADWPIDGVDQFDFFAGIQDHSNREGFVYYIKDEVGAVKWRQWKMHLVWETELNTGPVPLQSAYIFHLLQDPKEESDVHATSWARGPLRRLIDDLQASLRGHPPIPPGAEG